MKEQAERSGVRPRGAERRRGERGSVLAVSAFGMLAFLLAAGLCVDISHFYLAKTELQNAADAAALAGASALNSAPSGITQATDRAVAAMNSYEFNNRSIEFQRADVQFAVDFGGPYMSEAAASSATVAPAIRFVKVETPASPVQVFFAGLVLGDTQNFTAEAVAGMSVPTNVYYDWLPLTVVDDNIQTITPGNVYTIRAAPQGSISPGNYQVLAVDRTGASEVREDLASGVDSALSPGDYVDTEPGVNAGPVRQGVNTRFGDYASGMNASQYPPDTNVAENITYAQYRDGAVTQSPTDPGVAGRRVVLIPIVRVEEFDGGRTRVRIDRFGAFFLRSRVQGGNGGDIEAEYIGERYVMGRGSYDPNAGPSNGLLVIPVLYR